MKPLSTILIHPTYFPSIAQTIAMIKAENIVFEAEDNYQKQTYRNRAYIAHTNGRLLLNVPIKHSKDGSRQKTREVVVENSFPWQKEHWRSLQIAYRTSPFFEYYEDEFQPLFFKPVDRLMHHNFEILEVIAGLLGTDLSFELTHSYETEPTIEDLRFMVEAKKEQKYEFAPYIQVHQQNHGFLSNLSILDLLFNEGPNALNYLESQTLEF